LYEKNVEIVFKGKTWLCDIYKKEDLNGYNLPVYKTVKIIKLESSIDIKSKTK